MPIVLAKVENGECTIRHVQFHQWKWIGLCKQNRLSAKQLNRYVSDFTGHHHRIIIARSNWAVFVPYDKFPLQCFANDWHKCWPLTCLCFFTMCSELSKFYDKEFIANWKMQSMNRWNWIKLLFELFIY